MATVIQKNGIKSLSNGNSLVHHDEIAQLTNYTEAACKEITLQEQTQQQHDDEEPLLCDNNELQQEEVVAPALEEVTESEPEIDIVINNVVCSFSVRCHLNLREIALNGLNVEYRKENGMITMKIRRPYTTASIWSSGKVTCTGATSEPQAKIAARKFARLLQRLGFNVHFNNYRVVNVLGTCSMPFAIRISSFSERHKEADYEPELHPGVTYKLKTPKATLKIFSTGSVTVTAPSVADVQAAIEHIFPLVYEFRKEKPVIDPQQQHPNKKRKVSMGCEVALYRSVKGGVGGGAGGGCHEEEEEEGYDQELDDDDDENADNN